LFCRTQTGSEFDSFPELSLHPAVLSPDDLPFTLASQVDVHQDVVKGEMHSLEKANIQILFKLISGACEAKHHYYYLTCLLACIANQMLNISGAWEEKLLKMYSKKKSLITLMNIINVCKGQLLIFLDVNMLS